jgi:electron transport complex protein RnfG
MKRATRFLSVLFLICAFSAGGVGTVFYLLKDTIEEKKKEVKDAAMRFVLPGANRFDDETYPCDPDDASDNIIVGTDETGTIVGYASIGKAMGYSDTIEILVGVRPDLERIIAVEILSQYETPGLGAKVDEVKSDETLWSALAGVFSGEAGKAARSAEEPWFQAQFREKALEQLEVVKRKDPERIQAITAATISSKAATEAVQTALKRIQKVVGNQKGGGEGEY